MPARVISMPSPIARSMPVRTLIAAIHLALASPATAGEILWWPIPPLTVAEVIAALRAVPKPAADPTHPLTLPLGALGRPAGGRSGQAFGRRMASRHRDPRRPRRY